MSDTRWRSAAGADNADTTELEQGKKGLEELQRKVERLEQRDSTWALAEESLGDWSWQRRSGRDFGSALPHYQNALTYWSSARDVDAARRRYLDIAFRMGWPDGGKSEHGWWRGQIPLDVAKNATRIATSTADRAQSEFMLATVLRSHGGFDAISRMFTSLRTVVGLGKGARFHDDALFLLAQITEQQGEPVVAEDGTWAATPDFVTALDLYRRLQSEYAKGDTAWWDEARDSIRRILKVEVGLAVPGAYLPGSEIGYAISWRNAKKIELSLYAIDLTRAVDLSSEDRSANQWLEAIDVSSIEARQRFTHATQDQGLHKPGQKELRLDSSLAPGAYLLEAHVGDASARELVLVSRTAVVVKAIGSRVVAWTTDVLTSEPIAGAQVKLHARTYTKGTWRTTTEEKTSGEDGTCAFDAQSGESHDYFVAAVRDERQAFASGGAQNDSGPNLGWRIYALTDRSTYKPKDEVNWKIIARRSDGGAWRTPKGEKLDYEVFDPRGTSFQKGTLTLSDFGSAFGAFKPDDKVPLGEYHVNFTHKNSHIASAVLFRLEEYKLPEYEVSVKPATDDAQPKLYLVGDTVEVDVQAAFYSGGAVADASVVFVVKQAPFSRIWSEERAYPWLYSEVDDYRFHRGYGGQVVKQETLKTDAKGRARISFETPNDPNQDFEYTIEARVTDASRREVVGSGRVRVTRREYDVRAKTQRNLHRPGEKLAVDFRAEDANGNPVSAEGSIRVTRERWVDVWIDPVGREVSGDALRALVESGAMFPPTVGPNERPWQWKSSGYLGEDVALGTLKLGADGKGTFTFVPMKTGYYRFRWTSKDGRKRPIEAETWTWCVSKDMRELDYSSGGVQIVVDKDALTVGERAAFLLTTATSNRWVFVAIEGQKLHSYQVVHVAGTAKLITIDVTDAHVPNAWISAVTCAAGDMQADMKEFIVPPTQQFLDVTVASDRDPVRPGTKATLDVTVKNAAGEPVQVELALGLVDEAVASIQSDYARDIRQFFYGDKKPYLVQTHSSFGQRSFRRYVLDKDGRVVDEYTFAMRSAGDFERREGESDLDRQIRLRSQSMEEGQSKRDGRPAGVDFRGLGAAGGYRGPGDARPPSSSMAVMESLSRGAKNEASDGDAAGRFSDKESKDLGEIEVRSDFRETAFWNPTLTTGADGKARVEVEYPDSLTRWKATARAVDSATRVGSGTATIRAQKPLVARLQAPRFFTVGDETLISGVIGNRTDAAISATVALEIEGALACADLKPTRVSIPAQGEVRFDWKTNAVQAGDVKLTLKALGPDDSDAMTRTYVVQDHGLEVQVARSLKLTESELIAMLEIPAARTRETTRFTVDVAPSLAVTMLDALPYLVQYPYGCTEQTMSRFLPAAIVAHTLKARGLSAEDAMARVFGGIEPETAGVTHKGEKKALLELDRVTRMSLERLYDFQHSDGGWGWWKSGASDPWMSAYVVWGLSLARDAGLDVKLDSLERGAAFLSLALVDAERDPDLAAWMLHGAAVSKKSRDDQRVATAFAKAWEQKDSLRAYGKALLALAAHGLGRHDEAKVLCRNLANGAVVDEHPDESKIGGAGQVGHAAALGTVHWGSTRNWWRWQDGAVESTAFALRALAAIEPTSPLVSQASNWLVQNRRGAQWNNTRDTAFAILALDAFLNATGEVARDVEYELLVNGERIATKRLTAADMLQAPAHFVIPADKVKDGANEVRLRRLSGAGPLYLAVRAVFFSREDMIQARGSDIFVKRQYWKLVPRSTLLAGVVYDRVPLESGGSVVSGERIEVVLTLESKNDFEYLMFEDMKPAGFEAVATKSGEWAFAREIKSGEVARRFGSNEALANAPDDREWARFTGRQEALHQELRDRHVALFLTRLAQGVWEVRYDLRAEVPGRFSALPTSGSAMYVPEVRCNGDEAKVTVLDRVE